MRRQQQPLRGKPIYYKTKIEAFQRAFTVNSSPELAASLYCFEKILNPNDIECFVVPPQDWPAWGFTDGIRDCAIFIKKASDAAEEIQDIRVVEYYEEYKVLIEWRKKGTSDVFPFVVLHSLLRKSTDSNNCIALNSFISNCKQDAKESYKIAKEKLEAAMKKDIQADTSGGNLARLKDKVSKTLCQINDSMSLMTEQDLRTIAAHLCCGSRLKKWVNNGWRDILCELAKRTG